jgi:hypothetical protein
MKALSKIAVGTVAAVGLGFAAVAFSQGPGMGYGQGGAPGMGMHGGNGGGNGMHGPYAGAGFGGMHGPYGFAGDEKTLNERLTGLKGDLKITGEQAKAWEAFETAVRNQAKSVAELRASMQTGTISPEAHNTIMQQRFAGQQTVQKARSDLYGALTTEQKAVFDRAGPGLHGPRGSRG